MKSTLILVILFCTLSISGQIETIKKKDAKVSSNSLIIVEKAVIDTTTPSVVYIKTENTGRQPAFYINGEISNPEISILLTISLSTVCMLRKKNSN